MATPRRALGTILALMTRVLGGVFGAHSWDPWRVVLRGLFALPFQDAAELALWLSLTGRTGAPGKAFREAWLICGRRAGKSHIAALIATHAVTCRTYRLAPGERGVFMVIAADRRQARVVKRYISALLHADPATESLIATDLDERIDLTNGLSIEIHTASFRAVRGYTVIGAVCDEVAFWQSDESANPDLEILNALRPAMATIDNALLVCISSPYARRGEVWRAFNEHFGRDESPVLVVQAASRTMNPELSQEVIDRAYADDPANADAEYGAQFRRDVESFVAPEVVQACTVADRHEVAPAGRSYVAFVDPSGGSNDAMTLAIAHDDQGRAVVDAIRERPAPFDPDDVVREFAGTLRAYGIASVKGDRYAGEWPVSRFAAHGITYTAADRSKSELYVELLPKLNSGQVELLDHPKCAKQLLALERRSARGGRQSIDHPPRGKDDVINAVAGVVQMVATPARVAFGRVRIERLL